MKEWAGSADEDADSDHSSDAPANVSHNPPVRRENKKTERERKRLKLVKAEERRLAKLKIEKMRQSNVLRSVVAIYDTQIVNVHMETDVHSQCNLPHDIRLKVVEKIS